MKTTKLSYRPLIECPPITDDTPLFFTTKNGVELAVWNGEKWVPESEFPPFIEEELEVEDATQTREK